MFKMIIIITGETMKKTILLDMDGVIMDWNSQVLKLLGLDNDMEVKERMFNGENLEEIVKNFDSKLNFRDENFWKNIQPFEWALDLYSSLQKEGDLYILTSPGKFSKRGANFLISAISGKLRTLENYFPDSKPIFGNEKYLCANKNAILIDDHPEKIRKFKEYGGETFLWPHEYHVRDLGYDVVKNSCLKQIRSFN
jgi:5'(3')-deoxyribonucleotidase